MGAFIERTLGVIPVGLALDDAPLQGAEICILDGRGAVVVRARSLTTP